MGLEPALEDQSKPHQITAIHRQLSSLLDAASLENEGLLQVPAQPERLLLHHKNNPNQFISIGFSTRDELIRDHIGDISQDPWMRSYYKKDEYIKEMKRELPERFIRLSFMIGDPEIDHLSANPRQIKANDGSIYHTFTEYLFTGTTAFQFTASRPLDSADTSIQLTWPSVTPYDIQTIEECLNALKTGDYGQQIGKIFKPYQIPQTASL